MKKVCLVIGAGAGIGGTVAKKFAADGFYAYLARRTDEEGLNKLIGEIKKGQFVKISSKGDYGGNNFLDISMKTNINNNKKYLEIYSDLTRPLLTEYSFFKGLVGGKLFFTSEIDGSKSNSVLKIENFKV